MVGTLRQLALQPQTQRSAQSHRLSRELSELPTANAGTDNQTEEGLAIEDPTAVVALLNVAGKVS